MKLMFNFVCELTEIKGVRQRFDAIFGAAFIAARFGPLLES